MLQCMPICMLLLAIVPTLLHAYERVSYVHTPTKKSKSTYSRKGKTKLGVLLHLSIAENCQLMVQSVWRMLNRFKTPATEDVGELACPRTVHLRTHVQSICKQVHHGVSCGAMYASRGVVCSFLGNGLTRVRALDCTYVT
jgi:hypothetical protein